MMRSKIYSWMRRGGHSVALILSLYAGGFTSTKASMMPSAIEESLLDPEAFVEFVDGEERPVLRRDGKPATPQEAIATKTTWKTGAQRFGASNNPGPRYLRIGFLEPIDFGTVLAVGSVSVSVLKPDAPYPGNLADESQWIPAQRVEKGAVTSKEPIYLQGAAWILPPGTKSRALRFTHVAERVDKDYSGLLQGAIVLPDRLSNIAPQAVAAARSSKAVEKLNNEGHYDGWFSWQNMDLKTETRERLISEDPEWIMLMWPETVSLRGVAFWWPGFSAGVVQTFVGKEGVAPRDAAETDWQDIASLTDVSVNWPITFAPHWVDFGKEISTRALRLKMTDVSKAGGQTIERLTAEGKRVFLGEWFAFTSLGNAPADAGILASAKETKGDKGGVIPVRFTLPEAGYVTLVIEDEKGFRVRNLISETFFEAGTHTIEWNASADIVHDTKAADNGVYNIPFQPVTPGEYRVHGLWRKDVETYYEFSVYSPGNPPWSTEDHTGGWVANHSPPQGAVFVPGGERSPTKEPTIFIGCLVTEGPDAVAWLDLDGRKRGGRKWIGGTWTGAPFMAYDGGENPDPAVAVYVGTGWLKEKVKNSSVLRLNTLTPTGDSKPVLNVDLGELPAGTKMSESMRGFSARNSTLICSLYHLNQLLFVDATPGAQAKETGRIPLESPRGSAFDAQGRFLILSGTKLLRFPGIPTAEMKPETLISDGLENPQAVALDSAGNIYVSDWGKSHQVKAFTAKGKFLRTIGNPGEPKAGPYDPNKMHHPWGIAIDSKDQLWVAERDNVPRRVSVWSLDGKLANAFYGPSKYGGGGVVDPLDKTRFYYAEEGSGSMEFKLDWEKGTSELVSVFYRKPEKDPAGLPASVHAPENPFIYKGRRYYTNTYNSSPADAASAAVLFIDRNGVAQPIAALGRARGWELFKEEAFKGRWAEGLVLDKTGGFPESFFFLWVDANDDGRIQPEEVETLNTDNRGVTLMSDLSFCVSHQGGVYPKVFGKAMRYAPTSVDERGIPRYDLTKGEVLAENVKFGSGNQVITDASGWGVITLGAGPFDRLSISGVKGGQARWHYPNLWPGVHGGQRAPRHSMPGQVIGATRLLGDFFKVGEEVLWGLNSDQGGPYVFTRDGLFVATLFEDVRNGKLWRMPTIERGQSLKGITLGQENFWPTISSTPDGKVWLVDGSRSSIVRVEGLDTIRRIDAGKLKVTEKDLVRAQELLQKEEATRLQTQGSGIMNVAILPDSPVVDGKLEEWGKADWVEIDKRGRDSITATVAVSGDRLFAAWKSFNTRLHNSGENDLSLFKTGDALDIMIGADPNADPKRKDPVPGDLRLLITRTPLGDPKARHVQFQTKAILYKAVVPGTSDDQKVPFSSPWRTVHFDKVEDISDEVKLVEDNKGVSEISVPLHLLGLKPEAGMRIRGDIGVLQGSGNETTARTYWSNKASAIVTDVPAEAMLTPALWGTWEFVKK